MSSSRACLRSSVHSKGVPFFVSLVLGLAILAKPGMKGHWYPSTPSVFHTSLTLFRVRGHSEMPVTLVGSICRPSPVTHHPRSVMLGTMISHFDGFRK